jgi:uncharacterized protein with PIN domain
MENFQENYWHYGQMPAVNKECPECKTSIKPKFSSLVMPSNPPQQRWYWQCQTCGYEELGGIHQH